MRKEPWRQKRRSEIKKIRLSVNYSKKRKKVVLLYSNPANRDLTPHGRNAWKLALCHLHHAILANKEGSTAFTRSTTVVRARAA
jgi:hypothetical protein